MESKSPKSRLQLREEQSTTSIQTLNMDGLLKLEPEAVPGVYCEEELLRKIKEMEKENELLEQVLAFDFTEFDMEKLNQMRVAEPVYKWDIPLMGDYRSWAVI